VIARPTAGIADRFTELREALLDRLDGASVAITTAHATLKTFGSSAVPLEPTAAGPIAEVVRTWAGITPPFEMRTEAVDVFEGEERVPIVRLDPGPFRGPMRALWEACAAAGIPAGYADVIGVDGWIPHLSLVYPDEGLDDMRWAEVVAWARAATIDVPPCVAREVELAVFEAGAERLIGPFVLTG
jgi:2'-5' RNA ligase